MFSKHCHNVSKNKRIPPHGVRVFAVKSDVSQQKGLSCILIHDSSSRFLLTHRRSHFQQKLSMATFSFISCFGLKSDLNQRKQD